MAIIKDNTINKKYRLVFTNDNNFCSMPTYFYDQASNKFQAFSDDTNFRLKNKDNTFLTQLADLEKQREDGLQNNINVMTVTNAQTIFPREENTFLSGTLKRENFSFPWKDLYSDRYNKVSSSQLDAATTTFQSTTSNLFAYWPMDSHDRDFYSSPSISVRQGELMFKYPYSAISVGGYNLLHARFGRNLSASNTPDNSVQEQAGRGPFPNSYSSFTQDIGLIYKNYSILPEYVMGDYVRNALVSGTSIYSDSFNELSLKGTSSLANDYFLERYVHSDYVDSINQTSNLFPKHKLSELNLTVHGVKKLTPYDGFYPVQRTMQLSTLFSQSIAPTTTLTGSQSTFRTVSNNVFSRGLYNSIRAGIACDMPIYKSGSSFSDYGYDRVPFYALMNPNSYMQKGYQIRDIEPHDDLNRTTSIVDSTASLGQSDLIYDLAMNNFIAEVTNFFINNTKLTSITSAPNEQWKFDFGKYNKFSMNIVLSKDPDFTNHDAVGYYGFPHHQYASPYYVLSGSDSTNFWDASYADTQIAPSASWKQNRATATITFDATAWSTALDVVNQIQIPTIRDILTYSTVTFNNENIQYINSPYITSGSFMPLSSSVELFNYSTRTSRWNINTIWECPVHNFVGATTYNSASVNGGNGNSAGDVHRGIWHQYSTNTRSGLNLLLEYTSSSGRGATTGSLIEACGFSIEPQRVGNLADRKNISEYVVAIPYVVDNCEVETYFKIPLDKFEEQYRLAEDTTEDNSIRDLIRKSRNCVLPPRLNFVQYRDRTNREILDEGDYGRVLPPFAMYIFEFSSTLTRQDLSDIWQGVSPAISNVSEQQSLSIRHAIDDNQVINPSNLSMFDGKLPENIRFKVFKVKARSLSNYEQLKQKSVGEPVQHHEPVVYNWPYDYFSLIEMAKVDIEMSYEKEKETNR